MARRLAAILAWTPLALSAAATLPPATDLAADAKAMRANGQPMLVLYSQAGCSWCEEARRYLVPMAQAPETGTKAVFRQIDIDSDAPLSDFHGRRSTHRAFAASHKVRLAPTVVLYGPDGAALDEAIVGMRLPDFYAQYVINAIEAARSSLKKP